MMKMHSLFTSMTRLTLRFAILPAIFGAICIVFSFKSVHGMGSTDSGHVIAFYNRSCANLSTTLSGTHTYCWGAQPTGVAWVHGQNVSNRPVRLINTAGVRQIGISHNNTCLLLSDNRLYCGGSEVTGVIAGHSPLSGPVTSPIPVANNIGRMAMGQWDFVCASTLAGQLFCWGTGAYGQLGNNNYYYTTDTPQAVIGLENGVTDVAAGERHVCAVKNGAVFCWGDNTFGQVGIPAPPITAVPQLVQPLTSAVKRVAAGGNISCAIREEGNVDNLYCWGENRYGLFLGIGGDTHRYTPTLVLTDVRNVSVSGNGGCAIKNDWTTYCWGLNHTGRIGDDTTTSRPWPVRVKDDLALRFTHIDTSAYHTIARAQDGCIYAWGANDWGQLGNGGSVHMSSAPTITHRTCVGDFAKISPPNYITNQGITLTLSWGTPTSGTVNHYRYALTNSLEVRPFTSVGLSTSVVVSGLPMGQIQRWQVRACADPECYIFRGANNFTWHQFTTAGLPAPFVKSYPADNSIHHDVGHFSWSPTSGALYYKACSSYIGNVHDPMCTPTGFILGTSYPVNLLHGVGYRWQVRACADADCTVWRDADNGTHYTFYTLPLSPTKVSPLPHAVITSTFIRLQWKTFTNSPTRTVHHYDFCYSPAPNYCVPNIGTSSRGITITGLQPGVTYRWQVMACGDSDCTVNAPAAEPHWTFTVLSAPDDIRKAKPLNGSYGLTRNVVLSWTTGNEHGLYSYYCLSTQPSCAPENAIGQATHVVISGLIPGQTYYWQVKTCRNPGLDGAGDLCSLGDGGAVYSFTLALTPTHFSKVSPAHLSDRHPLSVRLAWGDSQHIHHYRYCFATTPCVPSIITTATNVDIEGLSLGTTYYWQVRACAEQTCDIYTDANNGNIWQFSTTTLPTGVDKISPTDGARITNTVVTLRWALVSGIHHYRYCIANNPGCTPHVVAYTNEATVNNLSPNTTYYWQVRACLDRACALYVDAGLPWRFVVAMASASFSKQHPSNGSTRLGLPVILGWEGHPEAIYYRYCYHTSLSCNIYHVTTNQVSHVITDLQPGGTYYWQVWACGNPDCSLSVPADSGQYHTFSIVPAPTDVRKISPAHNTVILTTTPVFSWTATGDVDHYRFCINEAGGAACVPHAVFVPPTLAHGRAYRWQVRACADPQCSVWADADNGEHHSFLIASSEFHKSSPYPDSSHDTQYLTLHWVNSSGASYYRYCYAALGQPCSAWQNNGAITSTVIGPLARGITYTWQVEACPDISCTLPVQADNGTAWSFYIRTPAESIQAHALITKALLSSGALGQRSTYLIRVHNPLTHSISVTLFERLANASELIEIIDDQQTVFNLPEWRTVIGPHETRSYTVTVRYGLESASDLVSYRHITNTVVLSDGVNQAFSSCSHQVLPNRLYIPSIQRPCESADMAPDAYEPDDNSRTGPTVFYTSPLLVRNLHSHRDADYIRIAFRQGDGRKFILRTSFNSGQYGHRLTIYKPNGESETIYTRFRDSSPFFEVETNNLTTELLLEVRADTMPTYCQTTYTVQLIRRE